MTQYFVPTRTVTVPRRQPKRLRRYALLGLGGLTALSLTIAALTGTLGRMYETIDSDLYGLTADLGFRVHDVTLEGRQFTSAPAILQALGLKQGDPILAFSAPDARAALEQLPQIASAEVERRLPDTISIKLVERPPMAIWQCEGKMMLIDHDGVVLGENQLAQYNTLPMVVGENAAKSAASILDMVASEPALAKRVTAYIRVGDRRWNLRLDNNVELKLPETEAEAAIHRIAAVEAQNGLFERDVLAVDLRLPGKLVVETSQPRDPKRKSPSQQGI
jgi:cell division protein FtsQ